MYLTWKRRKARIMNSNFWNLWIGIWYKLNQKQQAKVTATDVD